jgi:hypothetical protein
MHLKCGLHRPAPGDRIVEADGSEWVVTRVIVAAFGARHIVHVTPVQPAVEPPTAPPPAPAEVAAMVATEKPARKPSRAK